MFDISWSELLILGIVTLIFVGPKDLPVFMRTLGRYAGAVKRQVGEVRAQFEVVVREAELDRMRKEVEGVQTSIDAEMAGVKEAISAQPGSADGTNQESPPSRLDHADHWAKPALSSQLAAMPPMPPMPAPPAGR
jgi:sec-independent protein translocase protein TatB